MAQTIKHRRGKLESIKDITPINGELIIASGSDLSVHQEGLLFVGVEGNVLTPANKILTGSATAADLTGTDFDHSVDGIPYYETDAKKLTILGHGGNTDVILAKSQIDFKGSGVVSSSAQVSELAGIENSTITLAAGDGLKTGGSFTLNNSSDSTITFDFDASDVAGDGLGTNGEDLKVNVDDSSIEIDSDTLQVKALGITNAMLAGSITAAKLGGSIGNSKLSNSTISGVSLGSNLNSLSITANGGIGMTSYNGSAGVSDLALDIDGMTDIGAALVDADLMIVDDGAGGTNRKATMSRLATYMQGALTFASGDITSVVAGAGMTGGATSGAATVNVIGGDGITVNADEVEASVDDSTIELSATNGSGVLQVKDAGVTLAKIATQADDTILGNISGGTASPTALTAANVRTLINVADGANANVATDLSGTTATGQITINSSTGNNVVIAEASDTIAGLMSTTHHDKLDGIAAGAEVNVATNLTSTTATGQITINSSTGTNLVIAEASDTIAGLMSVTHHDKLDGIAAGADVNVATNLSSTTAAAQLTIESSTGTNLVVAEASATIAGLMSTTHHDKLDGIEASATADQTGIEIINLLNSDLGGDKQIGTQTDDKMTFGGSVTVTGDLQVQGTTTTVDSTTVNIGDNILELNYAGTAADAGILVKDAVGGANVSGSLLWDASEDYWIAGALGSEARVVVGTGTAGDIVKFSSAGVVTDSILSESGTTLTIANDVIVSGLTASQLVVTNGSKQLVSSTDISSLTLTLDGGEF